ncbi:hypothetical protein Q2T76_03055 [Lactobacillus sp. YT155]|nr:hypothetical protein [Lactobacillus sp. YT155]MDO1605031.1 hypothetical protein [Lactobacillus sp. YT155]
MKELINFLWTAPWWQALLASAGILAITCGIIGSAFGFHRRHY